MFKKPLQLLKQFGDVAIECSEALSEFSFDLIGLVLSYDGHRLLNSGQSLQRLDTAKDSFSLTAMDCYGCNMKPCPLGFVMSHSPFNYMSLCNFKGDIIWQTEFNNKVHSAYFSDPSEVFVFLGKRTVYVLDLTTGETLRWFFLEKTKHRRYPVEVLANRHVLLSDRHFFHIVSPIGKKLRTFSKWCDNPVGCPLNPDALFTWQSWMGWSDDRSIYRLEIGKDMTKIDTRQRTYVAHACCWVVDRAENVYFVECHENRLVVSNPDKRLLHEFDMKDCIPWQWCSRVSPLTAWMWADNTLVIFHKPYVFMFAVTV